MLAIQYLYRRTHPLLQFLPQKLAEWIAEKLGDKLNLPAGAGSCSHCGMGIIHHVVIRDENKRERFIGSMCAEKVGVPRAQEAIRYRMTSEQIAARDAKRASEREAWHIAEQKRQDEKAARLAARRESIGHIVDMLRNFGGAFYLSLAEQLEFSSLSYRQAECVAKATSTTGRRNKRNAESFDAIIELCTADIKPQFA